MIKNWNNAKQSPGVSLSQESLTQPNEAWTIAELLQRHMNGIEAGQKRGSYIDPEEDEIENEFDLSKVAGMDLYDREQLTEEVRERIKDTQERIEKSRKKEKKAEIEQGEGLTGS